MQLLLLQYDVAVVGVVVGGVVVAFAAGVVLLFFLLLLLLFLLPMHDNNTKSVQKDTNIFPNILSTHHIFAIIYQNYN